MEVDNKDYVVFCLCANYIIIPFLTSEDYQRVHAVFLLLTATLMMMFEWLLNELKFVFKLVSHLKLFVNE